MADFVQTAPACVLEFILPRGTLRQCGDLSGVPGLQSAIRVGAREIRPGKRMSFFRFAEISPEREILRVAVGEERAERGFNALAARLGLDRGLAGSGCIIPVLRCFTHAGEQPGPIDLPDPAEDRLSFVHNLTHLTCICQRGKAEAIARAAMAAGCPPPAVSFGTGRGIRDRLGLLRIAVNPEKEIIETVVGQFDAPRVFEAMVAAGSLDAPGMGFIYTRPVTKGLFRVETAPTGGGHGASLEQIIRAMDELKGSQDWRATGSFQASETARKRTLLTDLVNIVAVVRQGLGDACLALAMEAGASGATITSGTRMGSQAAQDAAGRWVSREVEILDLSADPDTAAQIVNALRAVPEFSEPGAAQLATFPVPRALTYLGN